MTFDLASFLSIVDFSISNSLTTFMHRAIVDFWESISFWALERVRESSSFKR